LASAKRVSGERSRGNQLEVPTPSSEIESISAESIRRQTEKIIASRTFRLAAGQRDFLLYAVTEQLDGRGELLKEYSIGVAVFHREESFDPRLDSIVRTEARKLRTRLSRYFEDEGRADPLRIEIPVGRYAPVFTFASGQPITVRSQAPAGQALRIAVLPFMNRSPSVGDEYFADGLTDELTHAFTRVAGLEVVARTSAFQFKGQLVDVREIGRKLNVNALVEGSVRRSGNRLRILAQLDDATNGNTVWSESYDRELADLFAVQREISTTIVNELGGHFCARRTLMGNRSEVGHVIACNPRVYEDYLRGQYFWNRHTIEDFEAAIGCFEQAIAKEARFARAYTGLAYCYVMLPILKAVLPAEFVPRIREAASKALEIDPSAGEAHIALALPLIHDYDWGAAGNEFRRGLELCPSSVIGHAWYGTYLLNIGCGAEGLREQQKVLELDPASVPAMFSHAHALYLLRRYDEAIDGFRKALSVNPSFPREHAFLGLACIHKGSYARGIAELELARELTHGSGRVTADLAYAYAVSGNKHKALNIANEFIRQFKTGEFPAAMIAEIYIGLGDKERAFEWLHRAIDQKDLAVFLKSDPLYDPLRPDPRFSALLKRTNLT
jgi:TolB-like protein/tetratricopeptide (TPR) repeat protein